ncbi:hypothetical protein QBC39DRAFT_90587 [Podospora conica]|nr:hypothetical protein QBC39DRAFT_90587 [Schizothecium conicum]
MNALEGPLAPLGHPRSNSDVLKREDASTRPKNTPRAYVDFSTSDEWGTFLYPSVTQPRQQWKVGETVKIQFESGFASFVVELWQQRLDNMGARGREYVAGRSKGPSDVEGVAKTVTISWVVQRFKPFQIERPDFGYTHYFVVRNGTGDVDEYLFNSFLSVSFNILDGTGPILPGAGIAANVSVETSTSTSPGPSTITNIYTSASTSTSAPTSQAAVGSTDSSSNSNVATIALGAVLGVLGLAALLGLFFWLGKRRKQQQRTAGAASAAPAAELYTTVSPYPGELESPPVPVAETFKQQPVAWIPPQTEQRPIEVWR